jgi:glutathione synthase/RimK-type ligase-like ATP-grasp enzyme
MPRYRIFPYRQGSSSAKKLSQALGGKVLKRQGSSFIPKPSDVIINWGDGQCPIANCLNKPDAIRLASNKLHAFRAMSLAGVSVPLFADTTANVSWKGLTVVRHRLQGHSGEGIELVEDKTNLPHAPLYVQYIKKEQEYRVHLGRRDVGNGVGVHTVAVQRKARREGFQNPNWQVRNHDNGFVFIRNGFTTPPSVIHEAKQALVALGLDFGAVDVVYNEKEGRAYVLEINTAPGLEGQTITDYAAYFQNAI